MFLLILIQFHYDMSNSLERILIEENNYLIHGIGPIGANRRDRSPDQMFEHVIQDGNTQLSCCTVKSQDYWPCRGFFMPCGMILQPIEMILANHEDAGIDSQNNPHEFERMSSSVCKSQKSCELLKAIRLRLLDKYNEVVLSNYKVKGLYMERTNSGCQIELLLQLSNKYCLDIYKWKVNEGFYLCENGERGLKPLELCTPKQLYS